MIKNRLRVDIIRKNLKENHQLYIRGWFDLGRPDSVELRASFDEKEAAVSFEFRPNINPDSDSVEIDMHIDYPDFDAFSNFTLLYIENGETQRVLELTSDKLKSEVLEPNHHLDAILETDKVVYLRGWIMYFEDHEVWITDAKGQRIPQTIEYGVRNDLASVFPDLENYSNPCGFVLDLGKCTERNIILHMQADGVTIDRPIDLKAALGRYDSIYLRALNYYHNHGVRKTIRRAAKGLLDKIVRKEYPYTTWYRKHEPDDETLKAQRSVTFSKDITFSIVVPMYNTPIEYLQLLINSVLSQTYSKFELCLADGSDNDLLQKEFEGKKMDPRIKYKKLDKNGGISENTNAALAMATGDYIVLADHDDELAHNALFEIMKVIEAHDDADAIYSDEDKIDFGARMRYEPHFKSDFNMDLLCSVNYICHIFAFKAELLSELKGFDAAYDGAQDHDFILRCCELAKNVYHIPKILYHWRCHMNSTAENPENKRYAFEAGKAAVAAHYKRCGIDATVIDGDYLGTYHAIIPIKGEPLVSILIPNKDHTDDLDKCITSIFEKTDYQNFEIIVIENNSEQKETFAYYDKLTEKYANKLSVVKWEDKFNYSAINNYGATFAKGEYLLFLNNDTEVINAEWLREMLSFCQRWDVGIVGAKLLFPDDTVQHAGVVIGMGGIAGHAGMNQPSDAPGYFFRSVVCQDYSAVTAACLLTKKSCFDEVGGMNEDFEVAFNDIDYCMKVRELGKLVVFNPKAQLYHYESKSRGAEDTPEKIARFTSEIERFRDLWPDILADHDPYYNPNLTLNMPGYTMKP